MSGDMLRAHRPNGETVFDNTTRFDLHLGSDRMQPVADLEAFRAKRLAEQQHVHPEVVQVNPVQEREQRLALLTAAREDFKRIEDKSFMQEAA